MDAVIVMRADGALADWNAQAEKIFGWSRDEVVGKALAEIIVPPRYREAHHRGLTHYLATGEGPLLRRHIEVTALRRTGQEFPIELSITPIRRGDETAFLGFARDITARREAASLLSRQAREAALLYRVTAAAAETSSLEEVLALSLESICELIGWPLGHAYLPGPPGSGVLAGSIWAGDVGAFPELRHVTETTAFVKGIGLPGHIWKTREPLWVSDIVASSIFIRRGVDLGIRSAFGFPIVTGDEVVAVLEFFGREPMQPDPNLLLTARSMGDQVGRVLERRRVQEHQALLLQELDHRAKNLLTVVMGMASQTAKHAPTVERFTADFSARIGSLSRAYGLLTAKNWRPTTLACLVDEVVRPHLSPAAEQFVLNGEELVLSPKMALSVSMILHELTTNAIKYGALRDRAGRIIVTSALAQREAGRIIQLNWRENGVSPLQPPLSRGFGTKLIEAAARHELGGRVRTNYGSEGVNYDFEFPQPA